VFSLNNITYVAPYRTTSPCFTMMIDCQTVQ
jgi:hypothetical protein